MEQIKSENISPEELIAETIKTQNAIEVLARKLSGMQVPEFSSEPITVMDVSKLTGISEASVRKGIIYGWLPIGIAVRDGKEVHNPVSSGKVNFIIYPRKIWELTGHIWRGRGSWGE